MKITKLKINLILAFVVLILSFLTIHWHHQMYLSFKEHQRLDKEHQRLLSLNKQLQVDLSEAKSGLLVKQKAVDELNMRAPVHNLENEYLGDTRTITLEVD